ncbi:uncharacterized protein LOC142342139 [Convolutriloba macropyga]|uniref:uncharacterized protein LOC142342139 n=1 Tax=Convolutriloba macropyga TaxID=536237 RepID=UPI003F5237D8
MQNKVGEFSCFRRRTVGNSHRWSYDNSYCDENLNHFFCVSQATLSQQIRNDIYNAFVNHYISYAINSDFMSSDHVHGFYYLGSGLYGLYPSEKIVQILGVNDRECRRVASDVVSDSSASEYLGRFEFTPNVFTVVLKDDEGDEYCYDRVGYSISNSWMLNGSSCLDPEAPKHTLCVVQNPASSLVKIVQDAHAARKRAVFHQISTNSDYGFINFGNGLFGMYPEMNIKRLKTVLRPNGNTDADRTPNIIANADMGGEMLDALGVGKHSEVVAYLYDKTGQPVYFSILNGLWANLYYDKREVVYLEHVEVAASGLSEFQLNQMKETFDEHFSRSMFAFMVDGPTHLDRYGVIQYSYNPDKYFIMPQSQTVTVCQANLPTLATQYHPVNVFDGEEDTGAMLLANFNKYLAPNSAQHFAIYDFIKEMHCFHSENDEWVFEDCDYTQGTQYFFLCWTEPDENFERGFEVQSGLMGFNVKSINVISYAGGGVEFADIAYVQYALLPSMQTVQISNRNVTYDNVQCKTPIGNYMGDNPTDSAHALLLYEKYDIENFMYQNEDGGWECLTRVSNRWRTDNCFSPSGKSYWHFCLTTQEPWSLTGIKSAYDYQVGLPTDVTPASVSHWSDNNRTDYHYALQYLGSGVFYATPANKKVVLVDPETALGQVDTSNCDLVDNMVWEMEDALMLVNKMPFSTGVVERIALRDINGQWIRMKKTVGEEVKIFWTRWGSIPTFRDLA